MKHRYPVAFGVFRAWRRSREPRYQFADSFALCTGRRMTPATVRKHLRNALKVIGKHTGAKLSLKEINAYLDFDYAGPTGNPWTYPPETHTKDDFP